MLSMVSNAFLIKFNNAFVNSVYEVIKFEYMQANDTFRRANGVLLLNN